jgi:hydroxymethylpyrimidine/phosphomethylpyrimidine kinase
MPGCGMPVATPGRHHIMSSLPVVLTFGLSDATGTRGIQADQLACASMGCHPATVITAIVAAPRDADGDEWLAIDAELIEVQAKSVLQNMAVAAIKIGALADAEQVQPVAEALADVSDVPVVLDPVLEQARGDEWEDEELAEAMRELLLPQTTVVTVSLAQARAFAVLGEPGEAAETWNAAECARHLIDCGAEYALISDGEPGGSALVNLLFDESGLIRRDILPRIASPAGGRFHGAGDTMSAGLAGLLAQGIDVPEAVQEAAQYTTAALMHAFSAGLGIAVPDRLFWAGDDDDDDGARDAN